MKNKLTINELLKKTDIDEAEKGIILSFLQNNKIDYFKSSMIKTYLNGYSNDTENYQIISKLDISTISELDNCLELLIPDTDKKINGAFFTPEYIVNYIINELQPQEKEKNLDPSCGCGAFLVGLTDYYYKKYNKSIKNTIKENIYGSDILEYNIRRTKLVLAIYALQYSEIIEEQDFNLLHQDSLRSNWKFQFNNIVGNPPYVKFQDLSDDNREFLLRNWSTVKGGTFNLYFAFFELGYKLLEPQGKLGYITPNNYFTSLAGESLRQYFQQKKCVFKILDFNHKKVFEAQTYTAITFINKLQNDFISYDKIEDNQSPEAFLQNINGSKNNVNDLKTKKWRLLKSEDKDNINLIESIGTPIGKLFDICVGIATLKDNVFFIDASSEENNYYMKHTEKGSFSIEKEITRSVYKISDFKTQEEAKKNSRRIIFPYLVNKGVAKIISENEFKKQFPKCYTYLLSEKETLLARDKGKSKSEPFFAWGRTQGLTRTGKKIVNPTFSQQPRFFIVEDEQAFFTNGYGIYYKNENNNEISLFTETINPLQKIENIDVLQKILNSYIMHYYVSKTSVSIDGGYPCYQKNFIENFTIPDFSNSDIKILRELSDKKIITQMLIEKYQLSIPYSNIVKSI